MKTKIRITEKELIESLMNMKYSGVEEGYLLFVIVIHSLANRWKDNKIKYYLKMLDLQDD